MLCLRSLFLQHGLVLQNEFLLPRFCCATGSFLSSGSFPESEGHISIIPFKSAKKTSLTPEKSCFLFLFFLSISPWAPLQADIITHKLTRAAQTIPWATSDVELPHSLPLSKMAIPAFNDHSEGNAQVSAARQPKGTSPSPPPPDPRRDLDFLSKSTVS